MASWARSEPALRGLPDPSAAVACCQRRDSPNAHAVLAALLRLAAGDPLAARAVLQAVLPALAGISRRWLGLARPGRACGSIEELDHQVILGAYERIAALAGTTAAWPANLIRQQTERRIRYLNEAHRLECRRRPLLAPLYDDVSAPQDAERDVARELTNQIADAVRRTELSPVEASVIVRTRILGHRPVDVARDLGNSTYWLYKLRARAEMRLELAG
jgi:hypothetical protein